MNVQEARTASEQWVREEVSTLPGFSGAFFVGSINFKPDTADLSSSSDVDVKVLLDGPEPPYRRKKFVYGPLVLEVSFSSAEHYQTAAQVLVNYPIACHFTVPSIIADPSGHLRRLQAEVARDYARWEWVRKRCDDAKDWLLEVLGFETHPGALHEDVLWWLYASMVAGQILLLADLQDPTVRLSLVKAKEILDRYGQPELHEALLRNLGIDAMDRATAEQLLDACTEAFDVAKRVVKTLFFGTYDLADHARASHIDGTRRLIDGGMHREATQWTGMVHTWCQTALVNDAPLEVQRDFAPAYQRMLNQIGVRSPEDLEDRREGLRNLIPALMETATAIIEANPKVIA